jgi:hypothetical protein
MAAASEIEKVNGQIAATEAKIAELTATIAEADGAISDAYQREAAGDSTGEFMKGRPGFEAKDRRRKAAEQKADLEPLLPLLGERKLALEAAEAVKALDAAAAEFGPIHDRLDAGYRQAAGLLAELVTGPWGELVAAWADYCELRGRAANGGPLEVVAAQDAAAGARWNAAAVPRFAPLPSTVGQLVELLLLVGLDPGGAQSQHAIRGRFAEIVPDLSEHNVLLRAGGTLDTTPAIGYNVGRLSQILAEHQEAVAARSAPPPPPTPEQEARAAEQAVVAQRQWDARVRAQHAAWMKKNGGRPPATPPPVSLDEEDARFVAERERELVAQGIPGHRNEAA